MRTSPARRAATLVVALSILVAGLVAATNPAGAIEEDDGTQNVVGGQTESGADFPFVGGLRPQNGASFCTASLIEPQWALTAAHCVTDDDGLISVMPTSLEVAFGATVGFEDGIDDVPVARVVVHPEFDPDQPPYQNAAYADGAYQPAGEANGFLDNDVALIRLARPATVDPVPLASDAEADIAAPGQAVRFVGYGQSCGDCPGDWLLRSGNTTVLSDADAYRQSSSVNAFSNPVTIKSLYARNIQYATAGDATLCFGDSGGPLLATAPDGSYRQVGVASWGVSEGWQFLFWSDVDHCVTDRPSGFARVVDNALSQWIEDVATDSRDVTVTFERARIVPDAPGHYSSTDPQEAPTLDLRVATQSFYHRLSSVDSLDVPQDWGGGDWVDLGSTDVTVEVFEPDQFNVVASTETNFISPPEPPVYCAPFGTPGWTPGCISQPKPILPQPATLQTSDRFSVASSSLGSHVLVADGSFGTIEVEISIAIEGMFYCSWCEVAVDPGQVLGGATSVDPGTGGSGGGSGTSSWWSAASGLSGRTMLSSRSR